MPDRYKDVWILSRSALRIVDAVVASGRSELRRRGVLTYRRSESGEHVARRWLAVRDRYTTDDHAMLTGMSQAR